jgi:plasmid maintenance system killer protein
VTIEFDNPKHELLANNYEKLTKWAIKAKTTADEILATLDALAAAPTLYDLPRIPWHPHPLFGSYKGYFAVWISKQKRIIFHPNPGDDPEFRIDSPKTINAISIAELCEDYHKQ